jgi:hypothetical protein
MIEIPVYSGDSWAPETEIPDFPKLPIIPKTEYYGRIPFAQAFDVPSILQMAAEKRQLAYGTGFYLVDFASQAKPNADYNLLSRLDKAAHSEAEKSEGFLLYFRGDLDPDGYTRSFCVWENKELAKAASNKPAHHLAAKAAKTHYDYYQISMRQARLVPTIAGYEFDHEVIHTVGNNDSYLSIGATALINGRQLHLSA